MEEYATHFDKTKDIFLEFCISKRTQEKGDELRKQLRRHTVQIRERLPVSQLRQICGKIVKKRTTNIWNWYMPNLISPLLRWI